MSDNKYKNKLNKEKEKCNKLIEQLYGDKFYFMHGTTEYVIENILKSGKIKIGTHTDNKNYGDIANESLPFAYYNIEFDDVPIKYDPMLFGYILLLHPRILFENNDIIFNDRWNKNPSTDSIYVNKGDSFSYKKYKLNKIKNNLIERKKNTKFYQNYHEILFTKDINLKDNLLNVNLKDNLLGIIISNDYNSNKKPIEKLLKKFEYNNIKIYEDINEFPSLCDLLI
jgi:hypothetical protein